MTQLAPKRFTMDADYGRTIHSIIPEYGTPIEALLDPSYWAHVANFLKPWDRIEVQAEDGSYYAELMVKASGKLYANVELLVKYDLHAIIPGAMETAPTGYHVKYRGTLQKWCVLRDEVTKDGKVNVAKDVLKDGFAEEAEARRWMSELLKTLPPMPHPNAPKPEPAPTNKAPETTL